MNGYLRLKPLVKQAQDELGISTLARWYFTGHSLGGALSTLAALDMKTGGLNIGAVITFGSPRIGDAQFETVYEANLVAQSEKAKSLRFVAYDSSDIFQDAITMYPGLGPMKDLDGSDIGRYSRPIAKVHAVKSPNCDKLLPTDVCELKLHSMDESYIPAIALYQLLAPEAR